MKESQRQLELLTQQMGRLLQEKAELETRNRILEQVVKLNVDHVEQLQTNKVSRLPIQTLLLPTLCPRECTMIILNCHFSPSSPKVSRPSSRMRYL